MTRNSHVLRLEGTKHSTPASTNMSMLTLSFFAVFIANAIAVDYVLHPDKEKDFDGIAITNLKPVPHCTRKTKTGDRLKVHFNATMPDGKLIEST